MNPLKIMASIIIALALLDLACMPRFIAWWQDRQIKHSLNADTVILNHSQLTRDTSTGHWEYRDEDRIWVSDTATAKDSAR